jgi:hypothetical protein
MKYAGEGSALPMALREGVKHGEYQLGKTLTCNQIMVRPKMHRRKYN